MLTSLFSSRPQRYKRSREERSPLASSHGSPGAPRHTRQNNLGGQEQHDEDGSDRYDDGAHAYDSQEDDGEDGLYSPLLPIFSAELLDKLPIYNMTHSIRLLVVQRCETTLSWDQLRSPQVSQFLVKPLQQKIKSSQFNRATLYTLIANCLQFQKEGQMNPGMIGVSKTRGMLCELLAVRLLKEFTTRELIDALAYDFDPMQGLVVQAPGATASRLKPKPVTRTARISTLEIAIRAQSKRFLAHPLVVQQLEAIWAGAIVIHSAADHAHRTPAKQRVLLSRTYGTIERQSHQNSPEMEASRKTENITNPTTFRRTVTLYDPRDASIFKLSRLRVPRYRSLFSTLSYATMLALFLAVLIQRSLDISSLELVFWFWSIGYMLDEIVGFSEQGFSLYIISVWNAFDLGILLLFCIYYVLRLCGMLMPHSSKKIIASYAYDVLASTAVLLFPRLFSVLDHYRYFSQLLIAFRMMALDLVAILILIIIACSGFFVAFTLSFSGDDFNAAAAAYALFQMLMGFTPAAWEIWDDYNLLGKAVLTLFLIICHFLIVTILITVLTNSFMAVVHNANEEHQYLFAVNTISMVKSDALFSYIAPTNVLGWLFAPLRYVIPFRRFIKLNRIVIKASHLPCLLAIFLYERLVMSRESYDPMDLVEQRGRSKGPVPAFSLRAANDLFSPGHRLREPSVATFQKDLRLEEVFRRPFRDTSGRLTRGQAEPEQRKSMNAVQDWMRGMQREDETTSPMEQSRAVLERLERRRMRPLRSKTTLAVPQLRSGNRSTKLRSTTSDPEELRLQLPKLPRVIREDEESGDEDEDDAVDLTSTEDIPRTDAESEDEGVTETEEEDQDTSFETTDDTAQPDQTPEDLSLIDQAQPESEDEQDYFQTPRTNMYTSSSTPFTALATPTAHRPNYPPQQPRPQDRLDPVSLSSSPKDVSRPSSRRGNLPPKQPRHNRNTSTNTILYSPSPTSASPTKGRLFRKSGAITGTASGTATPRRSAGGSGPSRGTSSAALTALNTAVNASHLINTASPSSGGAGSIPRSRPRPIFPPSRTGLQTSAPSSVSRQLAGFRALERSTNGRRQASFNAQALDLASDLGDNRFVPDLGALPASFGTQVELWTRQRGGGFGGRVGRSHGAGGARPRWRLGSQGLENDAEEGDEEDSRAGPSGIITAALNEDEDDDEEESKVEERNRMGRIMLARMNTLEEGFREMLKEVKGLRNEDGKEKKKRGSRDKGKGKERERERGKDRFGNERKGSKASGVGSVGAESEGLPRVREREGEGGDAVGLSSSL